MSMVVDAFQFSKPGGSYRSINATAMYNNIVYGLTLTDEFVKVDQNTTSADVDLVARPTTGSWAYPVVASNNCIYAAPSNGTLILKWDTETDITSTISTGQSSRSWGGTITVGNKVFFFPIATSGSVGLVLDITTDTVSTITLPVSSQWYLSHLAPNGSIYTLPFGTRVLKINPTTNAVTSFTVSSGSYINLSKMTSTGVIYGIDAGVKILKFNTNTDTSSTFAASGLAPFPGGSGSITITPTDTIFVTQGWNAMNLAKIDTSTDTISYLTGTSAYELFHVKYHAGYLWSMNQESMTSDGCTILKIDPADGSIVETAIAPSITNNKIFHGPSHIDDDGVLYVSDGGFVVLKVITDDSLFTLGNWVMKRKIDGEWVEMQIDRRLETDEWELYAFRRIEV